MSNGVTEGVGAHARDAVAQKHGGRGWSAVSDLSLLRQRRDIDISRDRDRPRRYR